MGRLSPPVKFPEGATLITKLLRVWVTWPGKKGPPLIYCGLVVQFKKTYLEDQMKMEFKCRFWFFNLKYLLTKPNMKLLCQSLAMGLIVLRWCQRSAKSKAQFHFSFHLFSVFLGWHWSHVITIRFLGNVECKQIGRVV